MALALLDLLGLDAFRARLRVDTGTNRYFQLKVGLTSGTRSGFDWVDQVVYQTPVEVNRAGGGLLDTATEVTVSVRGLAPTVRGLPSPELFAQLFSFKSADGRAMSFSPVLRLDRAMSTLSPTYGEPILLRTLSASDEGPMLTRPRAVANRTCAEQLSEPRLEDLLGQIVRIAAPFVLKLLGGQGAGTAAAGASDASASGSASGGASAAGASAAGALAPLLQGLAGLLPGLLGQLGVQLSVSQSSLLAPDTDGTENRFAGRYSLSQPMIFGIDDAIIGSVIGQVAGPLLKVLPELLNSTNQARVQLTQSRNKLVSDVVSEMERRALLERVLQAQQQASPAQAADLQRLADLLQQVGAGQPSGAATVGATPPTPAAVATASSLSTSLADRLSSRAIVSFITAPAVAFTGGDQVLFARGRDVKLQVKLAVRDPAPATPLAKAIVRVMIKDPQNQSVLAEKVIKQHGLAANAAVAVPFSANELAAVPSGRTVSLLGEIRWLLGSGAERKALGAQEAVFTERLFVKSRGADAGEERELTDMARYRAFWDKVWESPPPRDGKTLWGLDVTMKFTVLLNSSEHSNGLMQTRLSGAPDTAGDELRIQTSGRMKAGIECSIDELAKLASLWDGEPTLDADHLAAFRTGTFASRNASDTVVSLKLDGPKEERGIVWVVPVVRLVDHTLGVVKTIDDNGQVTVTDEERAHFPLPVAVRVLGLRSGDSGAASGGAEQPEYHFDGYRIEHDEKVVLTPRG